MLECCCRKLKKLPKIPTDGWLSQHQLGFLFSVVIELVAVAAAVQQYYFRFLVRCIVFKRSKLAANASMQTKFRSRAGLTIVPFMPWHRAPRCQGPPRGHLLNFSYHITFYNYGSIRVWRRIGLFYQIAPVLKSTGHFFIKGALNPGPQDRVPKTRAPAKFYVTLLLHFAVWRHFCWQHRDKVSNIKYLLRD